MSEYIIHIEDAKTLYKYTDFNFSLDSYLREEIVRCRDCIYYTKDPYPINPDRPMMCERTGDNMVEPYGFCAWGERRNNG